MVATKSFTAEADLQAYKSGMPTSTFQEQGTVTLVAWFRPGGARVLGGWPRVTSPSALPAASSARAPLDRVQREKDMAPVFSCDVRFLAGSGVKVQSMESKDSLSPSTTRNNESNFASWSTRRRRPLQKGSK